MVELPPLPTDFKLPKTWQGFARHRHLLLTGAPGFGKTTLLKRLAAELPPLTPLGFYTEEIRQHGKRRGFRLVGLDGAEGLLALVDFHAAPRASANTGLRSLALRIFCRARN